MGGGRDAAVNARHEFTEQADVQTLGYLEYRARQIVRQLRAEFGSGGTRELLDTIQTDEDRRQGR